MRTVFEQGVVEAVSELARLLMQVQERVGFLGPILKHGMKIIDEAEKSQTLAEWDRHLTILHRFFQTNLNNRFPKDDDLKRYFREKNIDLGLDYNVW